MSNLSLFEMPPPHEGIAPAEAAPNSSLPFSIFRTRAELGGNFQSKNHGPETVNAEILLPKIQDRVLRLHAAQHEGKA